MRDKISIKRQCKIKINLSRESFSLAHKIETKVKANERHGVANKETLHTYLKAHLYESMVKSRTGSKTKHEYHAPTGPSFSGTLQYL